MVAGAGEMTLRVTTRNMDTNHPLFMEEAEEMTVEVGDQKMEKSNTTNLIPCHLLQE